MKIPTSARAIAVGEGFSAFGRGVDAISHNPAGLAALPKKEVYFLYAPHVQGTSLGLAAYGHPFRAGSIGVSYLTLRTGAMNGRDAAGDKTGDFSAEDRAVGLTFARAFLPAETFPSGRIRLGASVKHISSRIASHGASTFAVDLGAQASDRLARLPVSVGLALRNLGPGLRFLERTDPLPLNAVLGASVRPFGALSLAAGATRHLREQRTSLSVGTEYSLPGGVHLRGQYGMSRSERDRSETRPALSGGVGLRLGGMQVDYAFMPMGRLGPTQRVSLTLRFGSAPSDLRRTSPRRFSKKRHRRKSRALQKSRTPIGWHYWRRSRLNRSQDIRRGGWSLD